MTGGNLLLYARYRGRIERKAKKRPGSHLTFWTCCISLEMPQYFERTVGKPFSSAWDQRTLTGRSKSPFREQAFRSSIWDQTKVLCRTGREVYTKNATKGLSASIIHHMTATHEAKLAFLKFCGFCSRS